MKVANYFFRIIREKKKSHTQFINCIRFINFVHYGQYVLWLNEKYFLSILWWNLIFFSSQLMKSMTPHQSINRFKIALISMKIICNIKYWLLSAFSKTFQFHPLTLMNSISLNILSVFTTGIDAINTPLLLCETI